MRGVIFFLMALFLFADDLYHQKKIIQVNLNKYIKAKFSTLNYINSADLNDKKVIIGTNKTLKVYSLSNLDVLKVIEVNLKKLSFSSDKSKIFLLHKKGIFFILDSSNYKKLAEIDGNFKDFDEKNGMLVLLSNNKFDIYDIKTGRKLVTTKGFYDANFVKISPDLRKIVVFSGSYFYIFNRKGILLNKIKQNYFTDLKWLNNREIITDNGYSYGNLKVFVYDVITSKIKKIIFPSLFHIDKIFVLNSKRVLFLNNEKMVEYNLNNNKIEKKFYLSENNDIFSAKYYDGNFLIAYNKNVYVYSYIFDINNSFKSRKIIYKKNESDYKTNDEKELVTKTVIKEKKIYIKNKKPTLEIYASKEEGYAPLKVTFSLVANDEDGKIIAYYLNVNGKEYLFTKPKKVTYVFTSPGEYVVMGAVKDNSGNITVKKIKIKVKEETFEEFKKHL